MARPFLRPFPQGLAPFLLLAAAFGGCQEADGNLLTWWGPLPGADGNNHYADGRSLDVRAFTYPVSSAVGDVLDLAFVSAPAAPSCSAYSQWWETVAEVDRYLAAWLATSNPMEAPQDALGFACQRLRGASHEAFGGDGTFRALHLLMDATGGPPDQDLFTPARGPEDTPLGAEVLQPGTFVGRMFERSRHGAGLLPSNVEGGEAWNRDRDPSTDECVALLYELATDHLADELPVPNASSLGSLAASHLYYHAPIEAGVLPLDRDRSNGILLPASPTVATSGGRADFASVLSFSRTPDGYPYTRTILATAAPIQATPCPTLEDAAPLIWPELQSPSGDDDSAAVSR
jgi:hypothetical protein